MEDHHYVRSLGNYAILLAILDYISLAETRWEDNEHKLMEEINYIIYRRAFFHLRDGIISVYGHCHKPAV